MASGMFYSYFDNFGMSGYGESCEHEISLKCQETKLFIDNFTKNHQLRGACQKENVPNCGKSP